MGQSYTYLQSPVRNWAVALFLLLPALLSAQLSVSFLQTNASCSGACDGFASAVGNGGTFPYTYQWSTSSTGQSIQNLCAGAYTVTVTDAAQNTVVGTVTITQPNQLTVAVSTENQICGIAPDGTASAVPTGGTAPYTYQWSNNATGSQITGLAEGVYTVTVTDFNGCTAVNGASVFFWNEGLWLMITHTDILCFGDNNGTAYVGPMSGTPPYTYDWGSGFPNAPGISGLAPGTYTVTVTDVNGCSNTMSATVLEPTPLDVAADTLPAACGLPGSATVIPSGGTPNYTVSWSNGNNTTFTTVAPAGPLSVTVTDANGCEFGLDLNIPGNNTPLELGSDVLANAGCLIGGSARVNPVSGTPPFQYDWDNGDTTALATNLSLGQHIVIVTDSSGCIASDTVQIGQIPLPGVTAEVTNQATCVSGGTATATATGGTPPYTYVWNGVDSTQTIANLSPGQHIVVVTDSTGCTATDTIDVLTPPLPDAAADVTLPLTCAAGGSATASASGGTAPYSFVWSNQDTTATTTNLQAETYTVTVTDAGGCTDTATISFSTPPNPTVTITGVVNATCTTPGSATAVGSGGTPPYTYFWVNTGDTTATVNNLMAGQYVVLVTDAGGCSGSDTVQILNPDAPVVATQVDSLANCLGGGGVATATVTGGTAPFTFAWSSGATTATATGLTAQTYSVTVTDAAGCSAFATAAVGQAPSPAATATITTPATCATPGALAVSASGGTPPYNYLWSNGLTTASISGLSPGLYVVTVTDVAGCTGVDSVTIAEPPLPVVSVVNPVPATCAGPGGATANASGGTPPYAYLWDNNETTATATGLAAGTHTVTITDAGGCTTSGTVSIAGPPLPTVSIIDSTDANCSTPGSATAQAGGGAPPYTYLWDNGETTPTATNLPAGIHTVTLTDASGCSATASVTIGFDNSGGINIGDYVWYDDNQDGFQAPSETAGVPNVEVKLITAGPDGAFNTPDDIVVSSTTTDTLGKYLFSCAAPNTYLIQFSNIPSGYEFSPKDQVNNDCKDSDAGANGKTNPFVVTAGQNDNLCVDAGIHTVCVNVTYGGTICCSQTICEGQTPALLYGGVPPSGGTGPLEYLWMQYIQIGQAPPSWYPIPGATDSTYQPGPLFETAYFMRCVRRQGCINFKESNVIQITVLPAGSSNCPQSITNLTLQAMGLSSVKVTWTTLPEPTKYLYRVEHSGDKATWRIIGEKAGHEDASDMNYYEFMDHEPNNGMNYYRIKRLSASGIESVSEVREIEMFMTEQEAIAIYPNPVSSVLYIRNLMTYETDVRIQLITTSGQLLHTLKIPAGTQQSFEVPVDELPTGIYLTRILFGNGEVRTVKISKFE